MRVGEGGRGGWGRVEEGRIKEGGGGCRRVGEGVGEWRRVEEGVIGIVG